jgi:hypothetical protein
MLNLPINFWTYGLGWWVQDYRGKKLVWHGGQIDGYTSIIAMLPQEHFGLAALLNVHNTVLDGVLLFTILDALLGIPDQQWNSKFLDLYNRIEEQETKEIQKIFDNRVENTSPSLPISAYVGVYWDDWCGELLIRDEDGKLVVEYGGEPRGVLNHWHYDTFCLEWFDPMVGKEFAIFQLNSSGKVNCVEIEFLSTFKRNCS